MKMENTLLLGIDFGTGGCKTTVIDTTGVVMAEASQDYRTYHPYPSYSEQNPDDWFAALLICLSKIRSEIDMGRIVGLSLDSSTHNAVLLDKNMEIIRPTIMWLDQRSTKEVAFLEQHWGGDIFRIGYQKVASTWTLPQLLWIKNNEPDNFRKIDKLMFIKDYVRYLLTGTWETDFIDAQGTLFFDIKKGNWSSELCDLIGLPSRVLPPICKPTDVTGAVTAEASRLTGLREGIPVVCGTSDVTAEDYGAGAIKPSQCIIKLATAGNLNIMTAQATPNPKTLTYSHIVPDLWYTAVATNTAASSMRWFRDTFCAQEQEEADRTGQHVYQLIEKAANEIAVGSDGLLFHPYLMGERAPYWDPNLRASFIGASMAHGKGHFMRAVMEGVAFSLKDCFNLAEEIGLPVEEFILIGGGAKSRLWSQIVCDVLGKKVTRPTVTDASFGTALIAGVGIGIFQDLLDAVQRCVHTEDELMPDLQNHVYYEKQFNYYSEIRDKLQHLYTEMNK
ncbi:xylulokinase [Sphingobacterium sp. SGG-5]|uniref:xylulokinase n=1 Tax=Sphingobacterium sp. SGG-5 TaxID=2710881 RepID=UPI0013EC4463|nr:xylulokinase [Sphingobacterium sp. SGG-5]NGM62476.1 xylulokinase [Sphingobacterium sp. SGG-5]